jgi:hypothetical protein
MGWDVHSGSSTMGYNTRSFEIQARRIWLSAVAHDLMFKEPKDEALALRILEHIEWAHGNGALEFVDSFLRGLPEN